MTLSQAFSEHLIPGQQGQLVIKFTGDVHLCKILVEDGRAVHISHGRVAPEEVLGTLPSKTVEWVNFIAGYPVRKKVDFPLHENLLSSVGQASAAPAPQPAAPPATQPAAPAAPVPQPAPAPAAGPTLGTDKVDALINDFIDLVGPLGSILADKAAKAVNYSIGSPIPEISYPGFVKALAAEVPAGDRDDFIEKHKL